MRRLPFFVLAWVLCLLAPPTTWAQQLRCQPCQHGFDKVQIGDSKSFAFQLTNTGEKTLRIRSISEQGSPFMVGDLQLPMALKPGASLQLTITFTPTAVGWTQGVVIVDSNDPNSPLKMEVAGTGVAGQSGPELQVSPATLSFGNVPVGSNASLQATLSASNQQVTISSDGSTSSEFVIVGLDLPVTIQPGNSLPVTIQFTPNASGTASAKAGFISNAVNSPTVENLTGTGVAQDSHYVDLSWKAGNGNRLTDAIPSPTAPPRWSII
jgi:hypothetical protein